MAMSVRLDPVLEERVNQEAKRLGMTKSAFVKDTLERALGYKNPSELLDEICSGAPMGDPHASENVSEKVKARLRAKYSY
ncbi:MAG: ribbon-helix-helix protein, CopG family [Magnetococcales bacterium]|nr:ribbon-helix-helix protein, CopG family [Magnetococcales bacterium]